MCVCACSVHVKAGAGARLEFSVAAQQLWLVAKDGTRAAHNGTFALEFTTRKCFTRRSHVIYDS